MKISKMMFIILVLSIFSVSSFSKSSFEEIMENYKEYSFTRDSIMLLCGSNLQGRKMKIGSNPKKSLNVGPEKEIRIEVSKRESIKFFWQILVSGPVEHIYFMHYSQLNREKQKLFVDLDSSITQYIFYVEEFLPTLRGNKRHPLDVMNSFFVILQQELSPEEEKIIRKACNSYPSLYKIYEINDLLIVEYIWGNSLDVGVSPKSDTMYQDELLFNMKFKNTGRKSIKLPDFRKIYNMYPLLNVIYKSKKEYSSLRFPYLQDSAEIASLKEKAMDTEITEKIIQMWTDSCHAEGFLPIPSKDSVVVDFNLSNFIAYHNWSVSNSGEKNLFTKYYNFTCDKFYQGYHESDTAFYYVKNPIQLRMEHTRSDGIYPSDSVIVQIEIKNISEKEVTVPVNSDISKWLDFLDIEEVGFSRKFSYAKNKWIYEPKEYKIKRKILSPEESYKTKVNISGVLIESDNLNYLKKGKKKDNWRILRIRYKNQFDHKCLLGEYQDTLRFKLKSDVKGEEE